MTGSFVSPETRQRIRGWAVPVAVAMGRLGLTPNALTVIGFAGTTVAAIAAATQQWLLAGILVLAFGIFDLFDGALARATGRATKFGAFLDSTLDRTGESLVVAGVAVGCAGADFIAGVALAGIAATFASGVTYTRAKAEALGLHGEVGFAPRPERLAILAAGLVLADVLGGVGRGEPASELFIQVDPVWLTGTYALMVSLGLIAILSAVTVLQRIVHVKRQLESTDQ
ncbi:MAG TPA: CDP-alcohol phosphatidyltransferase family protein [Candidatus Limnocylindrales bacterium]|nr:CDP-alcohol phosphatidyltransferase family protein [Candidatus Limnocylindrales bacterium]